MSWEIQGAVGSVDDVDALVAAPTELPAEHESAQVDAVEAALRGLLESGVVTGPVYVRAGGHANPGGGPAEGEAHEMVTLTIDYRPPVEEVVEDPAEAGADETVAEVDATAPVEVLAEGTEPAPEG